MSPKTTKAVRAGEPDMVVNAAHDKSVDGTITGRFVTVEKDETKPIVE